MRLVKQMASQISSEGRRLFLDHVSGVLDRHLVGLDFWGPNINIFRDPRWGRGMETPGEDPYLTGQYAIHYVRGMQEGEDPRYLKTVSTLKHFAAYSVESGRMGLDAKITPRDLAQTYFPAFQAGIQQGRAESVMCSYNAVNGIPSCANAFLLQEMLRKNWDWNGYVVSDCGAVGYVYGAHHYVNSSEEAVAVTLKGGTDLNCGSYWQDFMPGALKQGLIQESDIDRALLRLLTVRIRLGLFDDWKQQPYMQYPPETVAHPTHTATALRIAQESIVLLKNEHKALPLSSIASSKKSSTFNKQRIAVLGPNFDVTGAMCGNYAGGHSPILSPVKAIKAAYGDVESLKGCDIDSNRTDDFGAAIDMAKKADVVILFMGIDPGIEGEGKDRIEIGLPGVQEQFMKAITQVQKNTILVLINGGPVDISSARDNPNITAILEAFYPGIMGGQAIADVLFGKYNPSGRLPYTMHKKEFTKQIPMWDMNMTDYPGRTYRYFKGDLVYPFGFGLSYTTFHYETEEMQLERLSNQHDQVSYRVRVTNTGDVPGDTSVLAFISYTGSDNDYTCPQKQLFDFTKIHLLPGESREVFFAASPAMLGCYHIKEESLASPKGWYSVSVGDDQLMFHSQQIEKATSER